MKTDGRRVKISDTPIVGEHNWVEIHNIKGVKTVDNKSKKTSEPSIAYRSLILAELFKPLKCGEDGMVKLEVETLVVRDDDEDDEEEEDTYETKDISFRQFNPKEVGKYNRNADGKWIPKMTIKKPKAKLVLRVEEPVVAEVRVEEPVVEEVKIKIKPKIKIAKKLVVSETTA
jgi:hypothetical protein